MFAACPSGHGKRALLRHGSIEFRFQSDGIDRLIDRPQELIGRLFAAMQNELIVDVKATGNVQNPDLRRRNSTRRKPQSMLQLRQTDSSLAVWLGRQSAALRTTSQ